MSAENLEQYSPAEGLTVLNEPYGTETNLDSKSEEGHEDVDHDMYLVQPVAETYTSTMERIHTLMQKGEANLTEQEATELEKLVFAADNYEKPEETELLKAATQEQSQEASEEDIRKVVEDPQVRANALINAQDIQKKLKGWFRIQDLIRKRIFTKVDPAVSVLDMLCLMGMCYRKEHRGEMRFHIQLKKEDRMIILMDELKAAHKRVADLTGQLKQLQNS